MSQSIFVPFNPFSKLPSDKKWPHWYGLGGLDARAPGAVMLSFDTIYDNGAVIDSVYAGYYDPVIYSYVVVPQ